LHPNDRRIDANINASIRTRTTTIRTLGALMIKALATLTTVAVVGLLGTAAEASQLHYQPVNPTFGGNPLNGSFLLSTANSNNYNHLTSPAANNALNTTESTADELRQALVSALISQASTLAVNSILGTTNGTPLNSGTVVIGGETISFNRAGGQINITLTDPDGTQTQVSVPVPQF
jgi:curli production assembly/transport component CsgF